MLICWVSDICVSDLGVSTILNAFLICRVYDMLVSDIRRLLICASVAEIWAWLLRSPVPISESGILLGIILL